MILFPLSPVLLRICSPMAKRRLIHAVNEALHEEMERDDRVILYGEDVRIGLFGDTRGLFDKFGGKRVINRSEEHTSELQSLMRISYAVFCLKKKKLNTPIHIHDHPTN